MFNKLKDKVKPTTKVGTVESDSTSVDYDRLDAYITPIDLAGVVGKKIETKITIGSELGEFLITDGDISPRHCTIVREKNVLTVVDHSSEKGTYISGKKLDPGKNYILNEEDQLNLGSINFKIEWHENPEESVNTTPVDESDFVGEEISDDEIIGDELDFEVEDLDGPPPFNEEEAIAALLPEQEEKTSVTGVTKLIRQLDESTREDKEEEKKPSLKTTTDDGEVEVSQTGMFKMDMEEVELDPSVLPRNRAKSGLKASGNKRSFITDKKKKPIKPKKIMPTFRAPAAHGIYRFFALLIDICFCLIIFNIFYVFVDFKNFFDSFPLLFSEQVLGLLDSIVPGVLGADDSFVKLFTNLRKQEYFDFSFSLISLVFLSRIIFSILLGLSLGQFVIGLRTDGKLFPSRLLGLVREVLGIFTAPFIIFDIPTFLGKRSFKELASRTQIYVLSQSLTIGLTIISLGVFLLLTCVSPLYKGMEFLPVKEVAISKIESPNWDFEKMAKSELLQIHYETGGKIRALPSFQIEIKNEKRFLTLGMSFVNIDDGEFVDLKKVKEFRFQSLFKDLTRLNPLIGERLPEISKIVHAPGPENKNFNSVSYQKKNLVLEIEKLVLESFKMDTSSLKELIMTNGPFVAGHRDFREKLENLVGIPIQKVSVLNLGGSRGLLFHHKVGVDKTFSFIPIGSLVGGVYRLDFDPSDPKNKLKSAFLQFDLEIQKDKKVVKDPIDDFTFGFKKDINFENLGLAQFVYERYFKLAKRYLTLDKVTGIENLLKNIPKLIEVLKENKTTNVKLMLNLTELLNALKKQDYKFFNINKSRSV